MSHLSIVALTLSLFACAGSNSAPPPSVDAPPGDQCTLGTPDHCGACNKACPAADPATTKSTCSDATASATCGIACVGESYDVDGSAANGCEALDDPRQDTPATAALVMLPDATNGTGACTNANSPCTVSRQIYSDTRTHVVSPPARPMGLEDWYKVVAVGTGTPNPMKACLNIGNFPADNRYEVCISEAGSMAPTVCGTASGGGAPSACVSPASNLSAGTFFVRLRQLAGTRTTNRYALFFEH